MGEPGMALVECWSLRAALVGYNGYVALGGMTVWNRLENRYV